MSTRVRAEVSAVGATHAPAGPAAGRAEAAPRTIASQTLFAGAREVLIAHHGLVYRLKETALGKLILTK